MNRRFMRDRGHKGTKVNTTHRYVYYAAYTKGDADSSTIKNEFHCSFTVECTML